MIYIISWIASLLIIKLNFDRKVFGQENVPRKGPFIFVSNHESNADPFLLGTALPCSKWFNYLAKKELFEHPLRGWYFRRLHALPLDRESPDVGSFKKALKLLKTGRPLILFPEGTRSKDGQLREAKAGVGFIVAKAGVPVLPAYIHGSYEGMPEGMESIKRGIKIKIVIGKQLYFNNSVNKSKEDYQRISKEIMSSIARLKEQHVDKVG